VVPINTAIALAERILDGDDAPEIVRGQAGVLGVQVSAANGVAGAAVMGVAEGSGAEAAGVSTGSVITAVDGAPVGSPDSLSDALSDRSPGDEVELTWTDPDGRVQQETVTLGEGPVR
jgi:S1-C subfamily serine protease